MFFDDQGRLRSLLASWTNVDEPDAFTHCSAGRSWLRRVNQDEKVNNEGDSYKLTAAVLIYTNSIQGHAFATKHSVEEHAARPIIRPGSPFTEKDYTVLVKALAPAEQPRMQWHDQRLLARGLGWLAKLGCRSHDASASAAEGEVLLATALRFSERKGMKYFSQKERDEG